MSNDIESISSGSSHTCALSNAGGVQCWGDNRYGQLGDGTTTRRKTPVNVAGLTSGVVAISAGGFHTCALTDAGGVQCWGDNNVGQIGDGTLVNALVPSEVVGLSSGMRGVSAGRIHTCALSDTGSVTCWGDNSGGQLGIGDYFVSRRKTPTQVLGMEDGISQLSAGSDHSCALDDTGAIRCWGMNLDGEVTDPSVSPWFGPEVMAPVGVPGAQANVTQVSAGGRDSCAVFGDGLRCWGGTWLDNYSFFSPVGVSGFSPSALAAKKLQTPQGLSRAEFCRRQLSSGSPSTPPGYRTRPIGDSAGERDTCSSSEHPAPLPCPSED